MARSRAGGDRVARSRAGGDGVARSRPGGGPARAQEQFGPSHRVDVGGHGHRQSEGLREHRPDRRVGPPEPGVIEIPGRAVDDPAHRHAHPQGTTPVPTAQVARRAARQGRQRRVLAAARRRRLDHVERPTEEVGGHDAGGAGADVDAEGEERFVVDLDRDPRPADGAGEGEIGAFPQDAGVEQGGDLAVDRRDAQTGGLGDHVTSDRAALSRCAEDRRSGCIGDAQRRGHDAVAGQQRTLGVGRGDDCCGGAHGDVLRRCRLVGSGPHLATQRDGIRPGSVRGGGMRNDNNTHAEGLCGRPDCSPRKRS